MRTFSISAAISALMLGAALAIAAQLPKAVAEHQSAFDSLEKLGQALFNDPNLSLNRTMACATCHAPDFAFTDPRESSVGRAVSLGDDGVSLGDRNAPTAMYARFSPAFHKTDDGKYVGGQFLDGRRPDLEGQAGDPELNPIEMEMPDKATVVARLKENPDYQSAISLLYGAGAIDDTDAAYRAMTEAIAAFERTKEFAPFDSRYDRYLKGEVKLTDQEELGRVLFFSQQFTNCNMCHQLQAQGGMAEETFTNYQYHNIGVPKNEAVRAKNGSAPDLMDHGLLENSAVNDPAEAGKFKVPTLRNVAVTGPYMHNGVFKDLRTVVLFYDKYNSKRADRQINPETSKPWAPPEVAGTLSMTQLEHGPGLKDDRIDALVAFLKTLTDKRYEPLLAQ